MKTFSIILFAAVACCTKVSVAQSSSAPDAQEPIAYIHKFFTIYKAESSDKALDYIATKNTIATISPDSWTFLKNRIDSVNGKLGACTGYELINKKSIASSVVLFSYLVKHKNFPIRFTFIFYKPEDHWVLSSVVFEADEMLEELKQSSKISSQK